MSVMLKISGQPWRCPCGANVLTDNADGSYTCNGCQRIYAGKGYVEPAPAPTDHTAAIAEAAREYVAAIRSHEGAEPSLKTKLVVWDAKEALIAAVDAERAEQSN